MDNTYQHNFLDYRSAEVHFIYGFLWKSNTPLEADLFLAGLPRTRGETHETSGWISPFFHERVIGSQGPDSTESPLIGAYQPTFIMGRRCLMKTGYFPNGDQTHPAFASLVVPLENDVLLPSKGETPTSNPSVEIHPIQTSWTVRLFSSGTGTFTVRISLRDLEKVADPANRFSRIHWLLRLVPNIDIVPEEHSEFCQAMQLSKRPIADTFLHTPALGTCRLFDTMRFFRDSALASLTAHIWGNFDHKGESPRVTAEETGLAYDGVSAISTGSPQEDAHKLEAFERFGTECWAENQSPFTFVNLVLSGDSVKMLRSASTMRAKEFGSIYAKLTLDNRFANRDFVHLTEDYLARALKYNRERQLLPDFSHDERLFFTFCRRGAVAATAKLDELPTLFVIPSILNLFEIIRARLLAGITISARLTEIANRLAMLDPETVPIDQSEYARLRNLVVANLENPLEYLFDGGSAAEMALYAEEALFVRRTWEDVRKSFNAVDRLMSTWESVRFKKQYGG